MNSQGTSAVVCCWLEEFFAETQSCSQEITCCCVRKRSTIPTQSWGLIQGHRTDGVGMRALEKSRAPDSFEAVTCALTQHSNRVQGMQQGISNTDVELGKLHRLLDSGHGDAPWNNPPPTEKEP